MAFADPAGASTGTQTPLTYGPPPSGGDDTAAIQAALPATGILYLPAGNYQISDMISVNTLQDIQGAGGGVGQSATVFTCTSPTAGLTFSGAGGISSGFRIDGQNIARFPMTRNGGIGQWVGRTFEDITVIKGAQDGITCLGSQNDAWYKVSSLTHARDCLVLDQGYGGTLFSRCEIAGGGRYNLRLDTQVPGGPWNCPMNVLFHQCIVEQTVPGSVSTAWLNGASSIKFDHVVFYASGPIAGPAVDVTGGCFGVTFEDVTVNNPAGAPMGNGVRIDGHSQVIFTGLNLIQNFTNAVYIQSGTPSLDIKGTIHLTNCTNRYGADPGQNVQTYITNTQPDVLVSQRTGPNDLAYVSANPSGVGNYVFETANGRRGWGNGTDYVGDVALSRRAPGILAVDNKNLFATGYGTTAQRPAPTTDMVGALRFNTDSKQLEVSDGGLWYAPGLHSTVVSTSGTFLVPPGVKMVSCRLLGGGGGGGGGGNIGATSLAAACYGGPGGGAGMVLESRLVVTPGDTLTVVIGAGGSGGAGAAAASGLVGNNGGTGTAGGVTYISNSAGKVLAAAKGGGAGPGGPGANGTVAVAPKAGGACGYTGLSYSPNAPGCGAWGNYDAIPGPNGLSGGASGAFSIPTNGGAAGYAAGLWGQPALSDACNSKTTAGLGGAAAVMPGCGGNGGGAGGRNGAGGAGGAGAPGFVEVWWVA